MVARGAWVLGGVRPQSAVTSTGGQGVSGSLASVQERWCPRQIWRSTELREWGAQTQCEAEGGGDLESLGTC